MLVYII